MPPQRMPLWSCRLLGVGDLLAAALLAVIAVCRRHQAHQHETQARAAATAATHLRAAYRATAPSPLQRLTAAHTPHRLLADAYADLTRKVLLVRIDPATTEAVLTDDAMTALTAAVHRGVQRGHLPLALVDLAVTKRELASADNPAEVLAWRLHRLTRTHPATADRDSNAMSTGRRTSTRPASVPRTSTGLQAPPPAPAPATRRTR